MAISSSLTLLIIALIAIVLPIIPARESPSPSQSPSQPVSPPLPPRVSAAQTLPPPPHISITQTLPPPPQISTEQTLPHPPPKISTEQTRPPPSPPPPAESHENQLKNIVDALIGAGDFGGWANVLSSADPSAFPLTATLFIPSDDATFRYATDTAAGKSFDPFLIPYHIVPQRLTFSDLRHFATHTRLPTLLPSKFIVITNNSALNFTVDGSQITQADIFSNAAFAVHGIDDILNYTVHGGGGRLLSPPSGITNPKRPKPTPKPLTRRDPVFPGEITVSVKSGASRSYCGILMILAIPGVIIFIEELFWNVPAHIHLGFHEHRHSVEECKVSNRLAKGHRKSLY